MRVPAGVLFEGDVGAEGTEARGDRFRVAAQTGRPTAALRLFAAEGEVDAVRTASRFPGTAVLRNVRVPQGTGRGSGPREERCVPEGVNREQASERVPGKVQTRRGKGECVTDRGDDLVLQLRKVQVRHPAAPGLPLRDGFGRPGRHVVGPVHPRDRGQDKDSILAEGLGKVGPLGKLPPVRKFFEKMIVPGFGIHSFHGRDYTFYAHSVSQNLKHRIDNYLKK